MYTLGRMEECTTAHETKNVYTVFGLLGQNVYTKQPYLGQTAHVYCVRRAISCTHYLSRAKMNYAVPAERAIPPSCLTVYILGFSPPR